MYKFSHLKFYCKCLQRETFNGILKKRKLTWCKRRYLHHTSSVMSYQQPRVESSEVLFDDLMFKYSESKDVGKFPDILVESELVKDDDKITNKKQTNEGESGVGGEWEYHHNYIEACTSSGFLVEAVKALSQNSISNSHGTDLQLCEFVLSKLVEATNISNKKVLMTKILTSMEEMEIQVSNLCRLYQVAIIQQTSRSKAAQTEIHKIFTNLQSSGTDMNKLFVTSSSPALVQHVNRAWKSFNRDDPRPPLATADKRQQDGGGPELDGEVRRGFEEQLAAETRCSLEIENVMRPMKKGKRRKADDLHRKWNFSLLCHFRQRRFELTERWRRDERRLRVVPFLHILPDDRYVEIMMNTMKSLPLAGAITSHVCMQMGDAVYRSWVVNQADRALLTSQYARFVRAQAERPHERARELWCGDETTTTSSTLLPWNHKWQFRVGVALLELMVAQLTIGDDTTIGEVPTAYFRHTPAVFNSYKPWGKRVYSMTIPHPNYVRLSCDVTNNFTFNSDLLPMMSPAKPWVSATSGGFLIYPTQFVRKFNAVRGDDVTRVCDALNVVSSVAWNVNKPVLDIQLEMFRNGGNSALGIPPPKSSAPVPAMVRLSNKMEDSLRLKLEERRQQTDLKKVESEMYSLYCNALFKFSIANYCRDRTFWLPHSLDFRGRVYPIPPHFNYMGGDENRVLFKFRDSKELGEEGLKWLKIHLVNLTDMKKGESNETRLQFADEMIDEIMDSADWPLEGRRWWMKCDEPWQTLAACMELTHALRSRDPTKYRSALAIYQDGSCNGLQHYAAMGRDVIGAQQVNLSPADKPQDIYSGVAANVESFRKEDAAQGHEIAQILDGMVTRKVVKQTVMTTVYGVTRFGGGQQIHRQLLDMDHFPPEHARQAANYLVLLVFRGLDVMFTGASEIKKWLQEIAETITKGGETVDWITPLGLHVVQPYYKTSTQRVDSNISRMTMSKYDVRRPNVMKQRNAFPPNFVHSLDAAHMMMTALECEKQGITFSAVHDCYWTHASDVDAMNAICRQQFVQLHSQAILEDLVDHLTRRLLHDDNKLSPAHSQKLRQLFHKIPQRGTFDLNQVNHSTYFFC